MPKVTITGLSTRNVAKDHKKVSPLHKPANKPGPGPAYAKAPTAAQDKAYNSKMM
jgi:hypothetical protein